jgi:hypothetical protein
VRKRHCRFDIQRRLFGRAHDFGAVLVELAFPAADDDGGEIVADNSPALQRWESSYENGKVPSGTVEDCD